MNINPSFGGCWPTPRQKLLLRAALLSGSEAVSAWQEWESDLDLDKLDYGSLRLLPLLHDNLKAHGISHPLMKTFNGVTRRRWYDNQILFRQMEPVLRALQEAGIKTMLLKGAALVQHPYKSYGLRPMSDLDVMVPIKQIPAAFEVAIKLGCTSLDHPSASMRRLLASKVYRATYHSAHFLAPSGDREFDLHWHALEQCVQADADSDFWEGAVPIEFNGIATHTLNPADQLLHICSHGVAWNPVPPIRWVADAVVIINATPALDWNRLLAQTRKRRVVLEVKGALHYLHDALDTAIPDRVLHALDSMQVTRAERIEYEAKTRPPSLVLLPWLNYHWYRRALQSADLRSPLMRNPFIGFPIFLQYRWRLKHLWQVPLHASHGVFKGIKTLIKTS